MFRTSLLNRFSSILVSRRLFGSTVKVNFVNFDKTKTTVAEVNIGKSLLDAAFENNIDMEGACGGQCACSTCHVIIDNAKEAQAFPEPDDDELDMLDLAVGVTDESRLACQLKLKASHNNFSFRLPSETKSAI